MVSSPILIFFLGDKKKFRARGKRAGCQSRMNGNKRRQYRDALTVFVHQNEFEDESSLSPPHPSPKSITPSRSNLSSTSTIPSRSNLSVKSTIPSRSNPSPKSKIPSRSKFSSNTHISSKISKDPEIPRSPRSPLRVTTHWLSKDTRATWYRPCSLHKKFVYFTDSFGKSVISKKFLFPDDATVVSFSGLDLVEYIMILTRGNLLGDSDAFSRSKMILHQGGRQYYSNAGLESFRIDRFCDICKGCCYSNFRGTVVIQSTINSAIKANRNSYLNQNINMIVNNAFELTRRLAPFAKIVFVHPQMPISKLFSSCILQKNAFSALLSSLAKFPYIGHHHLSAMEQKWHSFDGYHLGDEGSTLFWSKIRDDLISLL